MLEKYGEDQLERSCENEVLQAQGRKEYSAYDKMEECDFGGVQTWVPTINKSQTHPTNDFYCCTMHVVAIISFIPTHAHFYIL